MFRDKFIELFQTGYRSLRNTSEDLSNFFGVKIFIPNNSQLDADNN
jgi:hypothetical protein